MAGTSVLSGTFAGRYTIERELGRGATATVYLARDTQRGHAVAVKVLRSELAASVGTERFLREIRLNEQLHHPHIVPVLDSGQHQGQLYFVAPHMEDGSLREMLNREKQLPIEAAIAITWTIAQALDYAHQQNLIHRDVKPENILFTSGQACLGDFGIARAVERAMDDSTTETGLVRGTPAYMSPEQASGSKDYDGRTDQYSLACVLYEMLAGMPAFIGPTAEAIIAQRFQHTPRELRVYRPSVPRAVESVILKALSIVPADRYDTMAEFASALEAAPRNPSIERRASGPSVGLTRSRTLALAGSVAFLALVAFGLSKGIAFWSDPTTGTDSSQVAVFPFEASVAAAGTAPQELVHNALRRWQPLKVVPLSQMNEALRTEGLDGAPSLKEAHRIAARLGAGRFVVGQVLQTPTGPAVLAEYRDVAGNSLYSAQLDVPRDSSRVRAAYGALVDSLLLRGRSDGSPPGRLDSRHLYATQALLDALAAKDEWALERADTLLLRATELDPTLERAQLWLTQVRVWRGEAVPSSAAERAVAASDQLDATERVMATALGALSERRFPDACAAFQELVQQNSRSFAGWYGLGECNRRNTDVVRDSRSPSGWRFVSSYAAELRAYTRAFELLPTIHRGFQAGAYSRLRGLLFTSGRTVRRGLAADGSGREFLARLQLMNDSLVLVPFENTSVRSVNPRANADPRAIARSRTTFHAIVSRWSAAFPNSPVAKEAVAISLELQSDRAALDTVLAAERLSTDLNQRLRFATFRVLLLIKFGIPNETTQLRAAMATADSLLAAQAAPDPHAAALLAPLAALMGMCERTSELLRRAAQPATVAGFRVPADVVADANSLGAHVMLGCAQKPDAPTAASIARRIPIPENATEPRLAAEYQLLGSSVAAANPLDSAWVVRLSGVGDYLLRAEADVLQGRRDAALSSMRRVAANRSGQMPGELSPDAILPESLLLLQLGDTATALANLTAVLDHIDRSEPLAPFNPANNVARMAALVRAMALRAELAGSRDTLEAKRWSRAVGILWSSASQDQRAVLARMKELSGS